MIGQAVVITENTEAAETSWLLSGCPGTCGKAGTDGEINKCAGFRSSTQPIQLVPARSSKKRVGLRHCSFNNFKFCSELVSIVVLPSYQSSGIVLRNPSFSACANDFCIANFAAM
jgi:hypothetical protein